MLGIGHVRDLLSKQIGPSGLRSAMAALATATEQLNRIGFDVAGEADQGVPVLRIEEYTAAELTKIEAQAECEHRGLQSVDDEPTTTDA